MDNELAAALIEGWRTDGYLVDGIFGTDPAEHEALALAACSRPVRMICDPRRHDGIRKITPGRALTHHSR